MKEYLWTEKYRPKKVEDYVFRDLDFKRAVEGWIKEGNIPNILLTGKAGTGKTSVAKLLVHNLGIHPCDFLELNASRNNSVDDVRDTVTRFVELMPFKMGGIKVVLLDEADYASKNMQAALRGVLEEYSDTARFIFTANFSNKILPALHSRCQSFHIDSLDQDEFVIRAATILTEENIDFDIETLDTFVSITYPDMRKCINMLQQNCAGGKLSAPSVVDKVDGEWRFEMAALFKAGKITQARKLVCSKAQNEEFEELYRWLYDNITLWGDTPEQQDQAILAIKQGLVDHSMVADAEICFAATCVKLSRILEGK